MGPRTGLDGCEECRPPPGFDPRIVQPVTSCCTDYAVTAMPLRFEGLKINQHIKIKAKRAVQMQCTYHAVLDCQHPAAWTLTSRRMDGNDETAGAGVASGYFRKQ
jgi:hypothetical protein